VQVIPVVLEIALCHAILEVKVCVGVGAVGERTLVVVYLNMLGKRFG
jgi:hypothetical protein